MSEYSTLIPATFNFVENDLGDQASRKRAQDNNSTRPATVEATYISKGVGQQRIGRPVLFPITFAVEPHFTSGCSTIANGDHRYWHDPIGTVGVYQWQIDGRDNFIGAWLWVRVEAHALDDDSPATTPAQDYAKAQKAQAALKKMRTQHYLTFTGRAIKDLPLTGVPNSLPPRTVNL